jgi:hypothetical protein
MISQPPHYLNRAEWLASYDAEIEAIHKHGQPARRDAFNAEFPPPWTGPVTPKSHARWAAICDRSDWRITYA